MPTTSRIPAVIDYLVATLAADTGLAALAFDDQTGVVVYDGTEPSDEAPKQALYVGVDDPDSDDQTVANGEQDWAGLGKGSRDEMITIWLTAETWYGDNAVKPARDAAYAIVGRVEDITRADASLGGTVLFTLPGVTGHRLKQGWLEQIGCRARVTFRIDAKARLQ